MSFKDILGHEHIVRYFKKALANDMVSHAYIMSGTEGIGKRLVGRELAKALLCSSEKTDSCGACHSCVMMDTGNHPDFLQVEPEGTSIKTHQVESLQKYLFVKPYEADKKIVIIDEAHTLTLQAQNKLLKAIEEPPEYIVIIFVTDNEEALLSTVRSRSQSIKFNDLPKAVLKNYIMERGSVDDINGEIIATLAGGSFNMMLSLLDDDAFIEMRNKILDTIDYIIQEKTQKLIQSLPFFFENKDKIIQILDIMIIWFRDILIYAETEDKSRIMNSDKVWDIVDQSKSVDLRAVQQFVFDMDQTKVDIREHMNYELVIETLLLGFRAK